MKKEKIVILRMSAEDKKALRKLAKNQGKTMSEYIRIGLKKENGK